jgi:hypothetical protein
MTAAILLAAVLAEFSKAGVEFKVESETVRIDPAKSVFLRVELKIPKGTDAAMPDLRERAVGFSVAEDFSEPEVVAPDGAVTRTVNWKLVPEPCAEVYKIKPFAVAGNVAGPVYFESPAPREAVTGEMEVDPEKDLPPLSWKLVGWIAAAMSAFAAFVAALWYGVRYLVRKVREHRMSPIERAWAELDRLLGRGLPGRGRYKDFYVELTMVVRRYIQRNVEDPLAETIIAGYKSGIGKIILEHVGDARCAPAFLCVSLDGFLGCSVLTDIVEVNGFVCEVCRMGMEHGCRNDFQHHHQHQQQAHKPLEEPFFHHASSFLENIVCHTDWMSRARLWHSPRVCSFEIGILSFPLILCTSGYALKFHLPAMHHVR